MREYITNTLLLAVTLAWLLPFWQIVTQGHVYANEPNTIILALEMTALVAILVFSIFNMVKKLIEVK